MDACLEAGGATNGESYYSFTFSPSVKDHCHISQLEAINCLAAARAFTTKSDRGGTVTIHCDNTATVETYNAGRARNPVLQACAWALWYLSATRDILFNFMHIPREDIQVADALSCVSPSPAYRASAARYVALYDLKPHKVSCSMFNVSVFS